MKGRIPLSQQYHRKWIQRDRIVLSSLSFLEPLLHSLITAHNSSLKVFVHLDGKLSKIVFHCISDAPVLKELYKEHHRFGIF